MDLPQYREGRDLQTKLAGLIKLLVLFVGLGILLGSVQLGESFANAWASDMGGIVDSNQYNVILVSYIHIYLVLGGILFGVGLFYVLGDLKDWIKKR